VGPERENIRYSSWGEKEEGGGKKGGKKTWRMEGQETGGMVVGGWGNTER